MPMYKRKDVQMPYRRISSKLLEEIKFTARAVTEIVGREVECEGLILSDHGGNLGRYSLLPKQDIECAKCSAYGLNELFKEHYMGSQRVVGVWHSHGMFDVFHSSLDDDHLAKTILPLVKEYNDVFKKKRQWNIAQESGCVKVEGWNGCYLIKVKPGQKIAEFKECLEDKVLSIVVNSDGRFHAEEFFDEGNRRVGLKGIEDSERIDKGKIVREIGRKIRFNGVLLKDYPNFAKILSENNNSFRNELLKERVLKVKTSGLERLESILKGTYVHEGKRLARWEDRYQHFNRECLKLRRTDDLHKSIKGVESIVDGNKYLQKRHGELYGKIKEGLAELKHRSMFRKMRKKRISKRKSS